MKDDMQNLKINDLAGRVRFFLITLLDQNPERFRHLAPALKLAGADLLRHYDRVPKHNNSDQSEVGH